MKVNCLSCGHKVDLDEVYDNYDGQVKCFVCRAILAIKTDDGKLKAVGFVKMATPPSIPAAVHASR